MIHYLNHCLRLGLTLLLGAMAQFGCAVETTEVSQAIARDSTGIHIVENTGPAWSNASKWRVSASPATEIGADAEDPMHNLHVVNGVVRLDNGVIVVANAGTLELRMFDPTGASLRSVGRSGSGPGEFESIRALYRCIGDTLVVRQLQSMTVFTPEGSFVRTITDPAISAGGMRQVVGLDDDCASFLLLERETVPASAPHNHRQTHTITWGTFTDGIRDTIVAFPGAEMTSVRHGGQSFSRAMPWGAQPVYAVDAEHVYLGHGDAPEIRVFDRQGHLKRIVRWPYEPKPVSRADRALFEERTEVYVRSNPQSAPIMAPLGGFASLPESKPPYTDVIIDDERNLWVRQYPKVSTGWPTFIDFEPERIAAWWVFDPTGQLLGSVETPEGLRVVGVEDERLIGIWRDPAGVEHVRVYKLLK